jgi:hypothetical protein
VEATNTLRTFAGSDESGNLNEAKMILTIKLAIYQGDIEQVEKLVTSTMFKKYKSKATQSLKADIVNYAIISAKTMDHIAEVSKPLDKISAQVLSPSPACISSLQLFATNIEHLKHLDKIIKAFRSQQPLAHYICLPNPKYISAQSIDCSSDPLQAITCDESRWSTSIQNINTRHVGLMLAKGGANVHHGILYFDVEDDPNVFSHEVSHLLGFVDEYPLVKTHNKCQRVQENTFSHNIVVLNDHHQGEQKIVREKILKQLPWAKQIKETTPILQPIYVTVNANNHDIKRIWRLGTPIEYKEQTGLYMSESCDNTVFDSHVSISYSAYKPVSKRTQLRYYANEFPQEYLTMLADKPQAFLMPSFHYNIALALYQQGMIKEAKHFFTQAQLWQEAP